LIRWQTRGSAPAEGRGGSAAPWRGSGRASVQRFTSCAKDREMGGIAALKAAMRLRDAQRATHCKGLFNAAAREYPLEAAAGCTQSTSVRRRVVDSRAAGRDKLTKSVTTGATRAALPETRTVARRGERMGSLALARHGICLA